MSDLDPLAPITCYREPIDCHCPHGNYNGPAGFFRVVEVLIHYYVPPRWVRQIIGFTLFLWFVVAATDRWVEFFVRVARCRKVRRSGGDWASALSVLANDSPEAVKQREAYIQEWTRKMGGK
ncbi:hypothetical protein CKAH01_07043 [Colletotrichum kahawae]|uniref:Uncharacterized protein n=1 Tax=Colletotrichum kahawae TaxID=34407 RepID=A0AAD9Y5F4_COLKA|nr:hypothetical protein CKAH01_07043 [Colletotrichum kahawae]